MLAKFKAILLDMNSTFMFGEDRFGADENFYKFYRTTGGQLSAISVNRIIRSVYDYLDKRYPDPEYRERFPTVEEAIKSVTAQPLSEMEVDALTATFAFHERGKIPVEYAGAIEELSKRYLLGAVIDIWAPKHYWIQEFERAGVLEFFSTLSFSSESHAVKPSPAGFLSALTALGTSASETIVIGDSARRDLGGALAAGMDCILVGGAEDPRAYASAGTLLEIVRAQRLRNRF